MPGSLNVTSGDLRQFAAKLAASQSRRQAFIPTGNLRASGPPRVKPVGTYFLVLELLALGD